MRRVIFFRIKLYLFHKQNFRSVIQELLSEKYKLKNEIHKLMFDEDFIKDTKYLLTQKIVKEDHFKYQESVDQIVEKISKKFVNLF